MYTFDTACLSNCVYKEFLNADSEWLDFVCENRNVTYEGVQYEVIKGAVANDDVYRTVTLYMTGLLSKEAAIETLKVKKLYNQLVFTTNKALQFFKAITVTRFVRNLINLF